MFKQIIVVGKYIFTKIVVEKDIFTKDLDCVNTDNDDIKNHNEYKSLGTLVTREKGRLG